MSINKNRRVLSDFPDRGFVFWPVGTGDSTSVVLDDELVVQIDIRHAQDSNDEDSKHALIVDELERLLPQVDGEPYLAAFVLTHPDQDHCQGFKELLKRVKIGELWFTPRVFREYKKDLCDDAVAFRDEAKRRVKAVIEDGEDTESGDRVRIIGYDDLLKEEEFEGFPESRLTIPGSSIEEIDGRDVTGFFRAFVHAPFKDDSTGERNDTSVAFQITLTEGEKNGRFLAFGDLCYPTIRRIFTRSKQDDLEWNVMLAAHHCSKSVMYWQDEGDEEEALKQDILDDMEKAASDPGYIVASSEPIPATNKPGDNPPHAKAKRRYEDIAPSGFLCTQEHPDEADPRPIVFGFGDDGFGLNDEDDGGGDDDDGGDGGGGKGLSAAAAAVRGGSAPPKESVGFGKGP